VKAIVFERDGHAVQKLDVPSMTPLAKDELFFFGAQEINFDGWLDPLLMTERGSAPTLTFGVLYCFFVVGHDRRRILHFNVTRNPHALWVLQQLREAWAYKQPHRFLLFDRDAKFGADVVSAVRDMGSEPTRTAFRSPWQNGVAERWVGSCRRDLLDHVIILNERHLKRLMSSYLLYYHEDRTHLGLAKDTPTGRPTEIRSKAENKIQSFPRLGGLHHRYAVAA
jgi:putative transposase